MEERYGCDVRAAQIVPRFAVLDRLLEQLAMAIATALRDGGAQDGLYVDTLAEMMAVNLARHHSLRSRSISAAAAKPTRTCNLKRWIDFIEENIDRDLSLEAMAVEAEINPLSLPRAFKAAVGRSPHQYVLRRRIQKARELLTSTDSPIADIALAAGFSSPSHLSNWFRRLIGVSPATYRRPGVS